MNIGRIFANAIARRVAYVIVAAALAWMGLSDAKAQSQPDVSKCTDPTQAQALCPSVDAAVAALNGFMNAWCQQGLSNGSWTTCPEAVITPAQCTPLVRSNSTHDCTIRYTSRTRSGAFHDRSHNRRVASGMCPSGQTWNHYFNQCKPNCSTRPPSIGTYSSTIPSGSVACIDGCESMVSPNGDGTYTRTPIGGSGSQCGVLPNDCSINGPGYVFNAVTSMCQPTPQECAENQVKDPNTGVCTDGCPSGMLLDAQGVCKPKEDDCPAGNVRAPSGQCLPGDGQCAAGEARRANGTCGRDSDGDGQADEDDDDPDNDPERESFSGGDSCNAPPSCSGGAVECGMARIQWRIDCNTRRTVNVTGGACSAMPVCVGENCKAMEYAQLLQQWRAACALEKLAGNEPGEGGDNQDLIDLLTAPGSIQPDLGGTGDMPGGGGYAWGEDGDDVEPDTSGMGWGSTCPSPPAISVFGQTINFNLTPLCNWLALAGNLVLILASLASLRIVAGGTA